MWPNLHETANLVTFPEEIFNGKLHFLCSDMVSFIVQKEFEFCITSQDPTEIRNPFETLLVNLGPILKKLSRDLKV